MIPCIKHDGHNVLLPTLHCVKTNQKVSRPVSDCFTSTVDVVIKLLHCQKRLFSFQNEHFLYFLTNAYNQEPQTRSGLKNEAFSTRLLCEW